MVANVQILPASYETNTTDQKMDNIPKSARKILEILNNSTRPLDSAIIQIKVQYSMKTTRKGLKLLINLGIVEKQISLEDARKSYYKLKPEIFS